MPDPGPDVAGLRASIDPAVVGAAMHALCAELFPICRSITGDGVRQTLDVVGRHVPLERHEVPTGTEVFDWTVPLEWNVTEAYVADAGGRRVVDFAESNLHLLGYSAPVRARLPLSELRPHLHSLPDRPHLVPYRTSYYREDWGFCVSHDTLLSLADGEYDVVVDTTLAPGALSYGECVLPGTSADEVLLTAHVCHPSLANDNLSGISLLALLGAALGRVEHRYTYRLLFIPATIGAITWLARNEDDVHRIRHGVVVSGAGDPGPVSYKLSRRGDAEVDRAARLVLAESGADHRIIEFYPYGYDERQFCSPGFDLPVGRLGRTPHNEYPEYHTSGDDLAFVTPAAMADSYATLAGILEVLEGNGTYRNTNPKCEPQLGRRGLYGAIGGQVDQRSVELGLLWVLNYSDGDHDLVDIATRSGLPFRAIRAAADELAAAGLLVDEAPADGLSRGRRASGWGR